MKTTLLALFLLTLTPGCLVGMMYATHCESTEKDPPKDGKPDSCYRESADGGLEPRW